MAISDRITSIEEHIKESYQELEGIGIDTTGVNKNLENIPKLIDGYWETLPKVTGEGTSITLDNTKEGKMKINLKGNTSQETTTGVNLFTGKSSYSKTIQNVEFTISDSKVTINGQSNNSAQTNTLEKGFITPYQVEPNTVYTYKVFVLSGSFTGTRFAMNLRSGSTDTSTSVQFNVGSSLELTSGTNSATFTSSSDSNYLTGLQFIFSADAKFTNLVLGIELVKGNTEPTTYEPYTNGASPNPDYPQDIHVVSGDNSIDVCGKNTIPSDTTGAISWSGTEVKYTGQEIRITKSSGSGISANPYTNAIYFPLNAGETYTFSMRYRSGTIVLGGQYKWVFYVYGVNEDGTTAQTSGNRWELTIDKSTTTPSIASVTFTPNKNFVGYKLGCYLPSGSPTTDGYVYFDCQLEVGNQATTYEAYKGASYPISLGVENRFNTNALYQGQYNANASLLNNRITWYGKQVSNGDKITVTCNNSNLRFNVGRTSMNTNNSSNVYSQESGWQTGTHTITYNGSGYACVIIAKIDNTNVSTSGITNNDFTISYNGEYISSNPIELCKIGDYQDSIKKSTGKNLCNGINQNVYLNNATNQCGVASNNSGLYIQVSGGNYTISTTKTQERYRVACSNDEPSGVAQTAYRGQNKDNTSNSITIDTTGYSYLILNATDLSTIQIEKGSSSSDFEPYGKVWYKYGAIGKFIFTGANSENWHQVNATTGHFYCPFSPVGTSENQKFTNLYKFDSRKWGFNNMTNNYFGIEGTGVLHITDNRLNSLTAVRNEFATNNLILCYPLLTPTTTEITDSTLISQLEALNGARSYTTQTNINQENNDNASILNATALSE